MAAKTKLVFVILFLGRPCVLDRHDAAQFCTRRKKRL